MFTCEKWKELGKKRRDLFISVRYHSLRYSNKQDEALDREKVTINVLRIWWKNPLESGHLEH
jgi:hypothetical protein